MKLQKFDHGVSVGEGSQEHVSFVREIFTPPFVSLLSQLHRKFSEPREKLLQARKERQTQWDRGALPTYLDPYSPMVRTPWKVAPIPEDLLCRRVEITGPVHSAKMVIQMLSPNDQGIKADMAMLDFEDSMRPTWDNVLSGVKNVVSAVEGHLSFHQEASGTGGKGAKIYRLPSDPKNMAKLMVRCRGLHLLEKNILIDNQPIAAGLFDLAACFFHTARNLVEQKQTPKYYIPKCEHHLEARWWNDVFNFIEDSLQFPRSTLRATFLIETLPAAFQVEEILYELREHAVGLNVGRWDKIFSDIKVLRNHPDRIMPDRSTINMQKSWMANYAKRLVAICHYRGAFAMGGMAAFTPGKTQELREMQTKKVFEDKLFENNLGHDGCWVSHPYFIGIARDAFPLKNQVMTLQTEYAPTDLDRYPELLPQGQGPYTLAGLRTNIRVGIAYVEGWLRGEGCIAWDNLMEDLATLEISRAQTWQWVHHQVILSDGSKVTPELVSKVFDEECDKILQEFQAQLPSENFHLAKEKARSLFLRKELISFMTLDHELNP